MPTIDDLLELSTAHLPPPLVDQLGSVPGIRACATACGWLMWTPEPDDEPHDRHETAALTTIGRYARALGCAIILFADDAEVIDDLPRWD